METNRQAEKERLEIAEKKVDIQKKRMEIRKEKLSIKAEAKKKNEKERLDVVEKKVDIQKKRLEIRKEKLNLDELELRKIVVDEQKVLIEKISELRHLLSDDTIDDERTIFGGEPFMQPTIKGEERTAVKSKLIELLKRF